MAAVSALLMLAYLVTVKWLIVGHFEVRSLVVPSLLFGGMFWLAMSTLSDNGQINRFMRRHGLLPSLDRESGDVSLDE
jgi:hypothetical protein